MKKLIIIILIIGNYSSFAQINSKLVLDLNFADFNYMKNSAVTYSKYNPDYKWFDYLKAYNSPSVQQSLNTSASFFNSINYAASVFKINWFNSAFLNYLTETTIFVSAEIIAMYMPLGDAWLHEEFHRSILTNNNIRSYNQVNDFPVFRELISVNKVTDSDLIRFKNTNPQDFVRLHAAGIEGEYLLVSKLQSYNFFYNQQMPYFAYTLMWSINSFYYVWFCHTDGAEETTNQLNIEEGTNIPIRDFTGLDFTAWTYDLFRPYEPYEQRGIHPTGIGLDRYIKPSDLTTEELHYLKKQGFLQMINFASPMLLGINRIPLKIYNQKYYFNFAIRHFLTSFGNDISSSFFIQKNKLNLITSFHLFQNESLNLPGIEIEIIDYDFKIGKVIFRNSLKTFLWSQPEDLIFYDLKGKIGGLFSIKIKAGKNKFFPYFEYTAKSDGWVAGNEFQTNNNSFRFGISWYLF